MRRRSRIRRFPVTARLVKEDVINPTLSQQTLSLPFPIHTNPHDATAEQHLCGWARQMGLVRTPEAGARFDAARFGIFSGYVHPDASPGRLALYSKWMAWQFLADDQYADGSYRTAESWQSATDHLWPVFATGQAPEGASSLARALADILGAVYPHMSARWRERFVKHVQETFGAVVAENERRHTRTSATVEEYVANRRAVSSVLPCFAIDEFMAGGELPEEVRVSGPYQRLVQAATDVAAWTNDLYSWPKEEAAGEVDNLVLVLESAGQLTRREAIHAAAQWITGRAGDFNTAEQELPPVLDSLSLGAGARRTVARCVSSMRNWMAGTWKWSSESARYTTFDPDAAGRIPAYIDDLLARRSEGERCKPIRHDQDRKGWR